MGKETNKRKQSHEKGYSYKKISFKDVSICKGKHVPTNGRGGLAGGAFS